MYYQLYTLKEEGLQGIDLTMLANIIVKGSIPRKELTSFRNIKVKKSFAPKLNI